MWLGSSQWYPYHSWWRHQMETFSALLAICAGNSPVPGEFPAQMPVTRSFDVFFDLPLNKQLRKQSLGWWFETQSRSLWRHRNVMVTATSSVLLKPILSVQTRLLASIGIPIIEIRRSWDSLILYCESLHLEILSRYYGQINYIHLSHSNRKKKSCAVWIGLILWHYFYLWQPFCLKCCIGPRYIER